MAWHGEDENENVMFGSAAGDPRTVHEVERCLDQTEHQDVDCVALYGHIFELGNPAPVNTQRPADCAPDLARGFTAVPPVEPFWSFSRISLYSSPGFVEYIGPHCEDPRVHPERDLAMDVQISDEVDIFGYWYLSSDAAELSPFGFGTGPDQTSFGAMPCMTVHMELWTQRQVGQGERLAAGETTKTVVSTPGLLGEEAQILHGLVPDVCDGSDGFVDPEEVTEFEVNLGPAARDVRAHEGFVVGVSWYLHDGGDPHRENNIGHRDWNLHTGSDYPNRVVLPVEQGIDVLGMETFEEDGLVWIETAVQSPFGSYDVDTRNLELRIFDDHGHEIPLHHLDDPILRYSTDHDGHFVPLNVTYPWHQDSEGLDPGTYTLEFTALNWQHTATATQRLEIEIP